MIKYMIEIDIDGNRLGVREKAESLSINEIRQIVSILEEYKLKLINAVILRQQETDLNMLSRND